MGKCNKTSNVYGEQISDLEELYISYAHDLFILKKINKQLLNFSFTSY